MTACKAIAKLLKLNKILKIVDFRFCRDGSLRLDVKPFKNGARCRECGRRSRLVRRRAVARQWRDLPVAGREVSLGYVPREIMCPTHGRTEEDIPWAARHARVSYRFEYAVLRLCQVMTQKAASELLHMSASTLSDQLHRSIVRLLRVRGWAWPDESLWKWRDRPGNPGRYPREHPGGETSTGSTRPAPSCAIEVLAGRLAGT